MRERLNIKTTPEHTPSMTYLDNGATTRIADEVLEAMMPFLRQDYGNASSSHSSGKKARQAVEEARKTIATSINAEPEEIIFTSGGTESDNLAITGSLRKYKNHIITSKIEHPAVYKLCKELEKTGIEVTWLDVDRYGLVDIKQLESSIKDTTAIVSVMHANNEIGTLQDIKKIGNICRKKNVLFHTDGVQSYTKEKIDVKEMSIDMMSMSSHKIHGPKGTGALYIRKGTEIRPLMHGGEQEHGVRPGTENVAGIAGFAKAVEIAHNNRMKELRNIMISGILKEIPGTRLIGHPTQRAVNNVCIGFNVLDTDIIKHLDSEGIQASTGSACNSENLEQSHVMKAIGEKNAVRFTLSRYTTEQEISHCIQALKRIVKSLRSIA